MYRIVDSNNEIKYFQIINYHGLVYLTDNLKRDFIIYKGKMLYLTGIHIPKKEYIVKYVDIERFIDYDSNIHDLSDFIKDYKMLIKSDKYNNKSFYLKNNNDDITFEVDYYHLVLIMYSYYLMYQLDNKVAYKKFYEKIDSYLTKRFWERED